MQMARQLWCLLPALLAVAVMPAATAQSPDTGALQARVGQRGTIGLVLSGGGARGGAHIGVLKALEELRVPVHLVAGTSIGAAIGGFYAAGMSVDELTVFVRELDWEGAFFNSTPRRLRAFRRKRDDDLFLVAQQPGLNDGEFGLPTGIVQSQVIESILSRVTLPVAGVTNFDDLMIPFRAVAADIVTGEAVVLDSGPLSTAIRASMAIPAVLTPVARDDQLLVDGGIAKNLPVDVAREMGADVIIAVDVMAELYGREELGSLVDITAQLTTLLTRFGSAGQEALLGAADVLLRPGFEQDFSAVSFSRIDETIELGYAAVMQQRAQLAALALSEADYVAYRRGLRDPRSEQVPVISYVALNNDSGLADSVIEERLRGIDLGTPLDIDALEHAVGQVYGLEYFQTVGYALTEEDGLTGLEINLNARAWGPNYLQLGLQYTSSADANAVFGIAASYLRTAINERGADWRATLVAGDEPGLLSSFYQPLGARARWFFSPSLEFTSNILNDFRAGDLIYQVALPETTLELAAGRELGSWGELRGGVRRAYGETHLRVGDPDTFVDYDFRRGEVFARLAVDTLDSIAFPRSGLLASAEWRRSQTSWLAADADYEQVAVSAVLASSWGRHSLLSSFRYDSTLAGVAPVDRAFTFGGLFDMSGLNANELSGQRVARLGLTWFREIGDFAFFPAYAGLSLELGNVFPRPGSLGARNSVFGGSIWAGSDTPIGPLYFAYGRAQGGEDAWYVFLGRVIK